MRFHIPFALTALLALTACSGGRTRYPHADSGLGLSSVVLYRNGVGYFERQGHVSGDTLYIKVRKDHINDLLKSLTIVKRSGGQALSVSMPLDPQSWANAALSVLTPGSGSLPDVLDSLRGTHVTLSTNSGSMSGRLLMVELVDNVLPVSHIAAEAQPSKDHKITLLDDNTMRVVMLSNVTGVRLEDRDLAMQFHRSLDATAGEGMFQQVEVAVRLSGASSHEVVVSYVAPAPMWKPTYRVVLPEKGKGKALLQGWAVVDNTSGEDWTKVRLSLTSGAPIAFRYDLHTPRDVDRSDLTETGTSKRARAAVGETSFAAADMPTENEMDFDESECDDDCSGDKMMPRMAPAPQAPMPAAMPTASKDASASSARHYVRSPEVRMGGTQPNRGQQFEYAAEPAVSYESLRNSTIAQARASSISGLTRFDIVNPVTVPDGSSTMVAIVNEGVDAEETFLFRPGGAGFGYEFNPYRVVRFRNTSPFVLEPGPISIYGGGSFVGEGLSEAVGAGTSATIPFAVEPGIMVTSSVDRTGDDMRLIKIVRGILEIESFSRTSTTWKVKSQTKKDGFTVLIRHPKESSNHEIIDRPGGTEDVANAYLVPVVVPAGKQDGSVRVTEQTPSRMHISIWDSRTTKVLDTLLASKDISPQDRTKLEPLIKLRQDIGRIDTEIDGLRQQRESLDQRASETRRSLISIAKDTAAAALRQKLNKRMDEFTSEADRVGRAIVELQSRRLEKKIEIEDLLQGLVFPSK